MNTQTFTDLEINVAEWRTASTTTAKPTERFDSVGTMDVSLAEIAMRQVNRLLENLNVDKEIRRFEQNRGEAFERFYGSMETNV